MRVNESKETHTPRGLPLCSAATLGCWPPAAHALLGQLAEKTHMHCPHSTTSACAKACQHTRSLFCLFSSCSQAHTRSADPPACWQTLELYMLSASAPGNCLLVGHCITAAAPHNRLTYAHIPNNRATRPRCQRCCCCAHTASVGGSNLLRSKVKVLLQFWSRSRHTPTSASACKAAHTNMPRSHNCTHTSLSLHGVNIIGTVV